MNAMAMDNDILLANKRLFAAALIEHTFLMMVVADSFTWAKVQNPSSVFSLFFLIYISVNCLMTDPPFYK